MPEIALSQLSATGLAIISPGSGGLISPEQCLTDGLGTGTPGYTAPEIYSTTSHYSFPVDIYGFGIVLYTLISEKEPFSNATSPIQIIMASKRVFFSSETQSLISWWKCPDPSDGQWQFPDGEKIPPSLVSLITQMIQVNPGSRPSAHSVSTFLNYAD